MKPLWVLTLVSVPILFSLLLGCAGKRPSIGVTDGKLSPCPDRPNCVSSISEDKRHSIDPFAYATGKKKAFEALIGVLTNQARATIIEQSDDYLHVEFKSKYFGFVDDVEFYWPSDIPLIHIRSASRMGLSDLGVNRKRMDRIRSQFIEALKTPMERTS